MARTLARILRSIHDGLWIELEDLARNREGGREPLKAVLSVLLAVGVASAMHLPDIVWAALSGFLVMRSTLAEALPRALQRTAGTIAGALTGLILARWTAQDIGLLMAALFVLIWIAVYQGSVTATPYAWTLFGVTAAIVLIAGLATPEGTAEFAAVRAGEIAIGSASALVIAAVFEVFGAPPGKAAPGGGAVPGAALTLRRFGEEDWLAQHWPLIIHAAQTAVAVSLLPLVWRFFEITNYLQTAITAFIVMIVPLNVIESGSRYAVYERMAHRLIGCLLGGALALLALRLAADDGLLWALCLAAGVWTGFHVQSGRTGLSYLGTQFAFAFLVSFVQGPGPATSLDPPLTRLLGVMIGAAMASLVILAWPSAPRDADARA
ncbi:MAG TPA: FUSC family protein [Acidisoma sp.]|uniref:FUSC family protein n=1 Tax=Acidisoma sp. TaxID=1872115 RepID=UPI002C85DC02|nr:FUSC family protein [Acidisoma sp.]HTI01817.1 FUSC family protein [Acidisoma sp.]